MKAFRVFLIVATLLLLSQPLAAQEEDTGTLKIALLPVLDTLPFYVAQENGYFEEVGVEVEAIPVASPVERDQIMQAGAIDGMLNELTTTATYNRDSVKIQALIAARIAYEDFPIFRVLAAPRSNITIPSDLAGKEIAVSLNTVIEYVTDRLLRAEGLSPDEIAFTSVPAIPERFQLLMQGQVLVATLPDPLAQAAIEAGAIPIIDDAAYPEYSLSTLSFSIDAIENKPEPIRRFLLAWDMAVQDLNANPEAYRALFLEKVNVPESVQETYDIPPFPRAVIPTEEQWADVLDWLIERGLLDEELPYEDSINPAFLPEGPAEAVSPDEALAVYAASCQGCHGVAGVGGVVGPDLADNPDVKALSADELYDIIVNGVPGTAMPSFAQLSEAEINGLVDLLKSWNE